MPPTVEDEDDALPVEYGRYGEVRLGDGGVIIYDVEEEAAWLQAGDAVDLLERV